ncbi:hypothetical protein M8818_002983 [Zalaria obscura]|uniref:Uncharacterized protein n=1 Tax=Zalaria obscura TaxID=2024903 RepID=A0ACC3SHK7_9PEZI
MCNVAMINHNNSWIDKSDKHHRSEQRFNMKSEDCLETRLSESNDESDVDENGFRCVRPTILKEHNQDLYSKLVDDLTATLARYLSRFASSELWHNLCLSILAKWAAKLKMLSKDPITFPSLSLEAAEDYDDEKKRYEYAKFADSADLSLPKEEQFDPAGMYHTLESISRGILQYQFGHILHHLLRPGNSSRPSDSLETSARIYETGQGRHPPLRRWLLP